MTTSIEPTVHLVDDDDAVRDSLKLLLESHAMNVCDYKSAEDFLSSAAAGVRECLVLDMHLPVLSGLDLIKIMRERNMRHPIVFITGRSDKETKARAMSAGAVAFLEKPVGEDALMGAIYGALAEEDERYGADAAKPAISAPLERRAPLPSSPVGEDFSPAFSP